MDRSGQGASNANDTPYPAAHLLGIVITGAILLAGCHACPLPDRQNLPCDGTSYSALRPVVVDETLAAARAKLAAAKAAEARQQEQCVALYCQAAILAWQQLELRRSSGLSDLSGEPRRICLPQPTATAASIPVAA